MNIVICGVYDMPNAFRKPAAPFTIYIMDGIGEPWPDYPGDVIDVEVEVVEEKLLLKTKMKQPWNNSDHPDWPRQSGRTHKLVLEMLDAEYNDNIYVVSNSHQFSYIVDMIREIVAPNPNYAVKVIEHDKVVIMSCLLNEKPKHIQILSMDHPLLRRTPKGMEWYNQAAQVRVFTDHYVWEVWSGQS